jgi:hypothetical protein
MRLGGPTPGISAGAPNAAALNNRLRCEFIQTALP